MKTKLLKKIRKRYSWVYQKPSKKSKKKGFRGRWLIVNHKTEEVIWLDQEYAIKQHGKSKPPVGWEEYKFRLLKKLLLSPFYHKPLTKLMYRAVRNIINRKHGNTNKI